VAKRRRVEGDGAVNQLKQWIGRVIRFSKNALRFAHGYASYWRTGLTPWEAFMSMRQLYCTTNGRLNDVVALLYRFARPRPAIEETTGALGTLSPKDVREVVAALDRDGCYIFPRTIDPALCAQLQAFALSTPMTAMVEGRPPELRLFDPDRPTSVRYDCDMQVLMENETAQRLVADPGIRSIAQAYLRTRAVQDLVTMWWSSAFQMEASSGAAQLYHFDLDRVKFLKIFIYLTDVGAENGPHCFIRRSHRRKPRSLLRIARISDDEIFQHYPREALAEITGPRGTVIFADTAGFHKGKPLAAGHRLIFQIEFALDLFGYNYPRIQINERFSPWFREVVKKHPYTYSNHTA
jgi:hypothetical protein